MTNQLEEIARRKQALMERCAREREELVTAFHRVRLPLGFGAVLMALGTTLKSYPILVAGISSLLVSGYGSKLVKPALRLFRLGQVVRPLWSWWAKQHRGK